MGETIGVGPYAIEFTEESDDSLTPDDIGAANKDLTNVPNKSVTANMIADDSLIQLGALQAIAAAAAYDPEGSYAVGDYCTHSGKLHKCNTPIPSGEAWNAEHWTATTVAAELAEVRESLLNKVEWNGGFLQEVSILEWAEKRGIHAVNTHVSTNETVTDVPYAAFWAVDFKSYPDGGWLELVATDIQIGKTWRNIKNWQQPWSGWIPIPIATPPQDHAIVPKNGATFIDGYKNSYSKDQFGRVVVVFSLHFESVPESSIEIFSLPQSFAPTGGAFVGAAVLSMSVYFPALVTAHMNGMVTVGHNVTGYSGPINLHGFLVIDTGGTK